MVVHGNELRTIFWEFMPRDYMRRLLRVVADAYSRAEYACISHLELDGPEADNTRWSVRRAFVEGGMRQLATQFPTVHAEVIRGRDCPAPNPWNHTLISCGRVLLTQCTVMHPDDIVRPSISREIYSLPNAQKLLFPELQPRRSKKVGDSPLYGILVHGREVGTSAKLGFAFVRFPQPGAAEWYSERINLFSEFADSVAHLQRNADPSNEVVKLLPEESVDAPKDPAIHEQGQVE